MHLIVSSWPALSKTKWSLKTSLRSRQQLNINHASPYNQLRDVQVISSTSCHTSNPAILQPPQANLPLSQSITQPSHCASTTFQPPCPASTCTHSSHSTPTVTVTTCPLHPVSAITQHSLTAPSVLQQPLPVSTAIPPSYSNSHSHPVSVGLQPSNHPTTITLPPCSTFTSLELPYSQPISADPQSSLTISTAFLGHPSTLTSTEISTAPPPP